MSLTPETVWWSAAAAGACAGGLALCGTARARGSTAVAATLWGAAAAVALVAEGSLRGAGIVSQPPAAAAGRLLTTMLAIAPALSLLGAKRPQHRVWQFIVAAFGLVLLLPTAATALGRPGSTPDLHLLGRSLVAVVILVGWLNHVATGLGPAATAVAAGVLLLARGILPGVDTEGAFPPSAAPGALRAAGLDAAGSWLIAAGALWGVGLARRKRGGNAPATFAGTVDPAWLALRDTLGAAWTLRIAERFDHLAGERDWPCRLGFGGLEPRETPAAGPWQRDARRAMGALFRRFADPGWLARHGWSGEIRGSSRNAN